MPISRKWKNKREYVPTMEYYRAIRDSCVHSVEEKKRDTNEHILHETIYMEFRLGRNASTVLEV